MSSSSRKERRELIRAMAKLGWTVAGLSGKGYIKMHCGCGSHSHWLHKTPSGVNYWRNAEAEMRRKCDG